MNVNSVIFDAVTDNLETVLDGVPILPPAIVRRFEYYAIELSKTALMTFYDCPDLSEKSPERLLSSIFDTASLIRHLFDDTIDMEEQECSIGSIIKDYDLWADGRLEKLISDDTEYMDYQMTKELAIEECLSLTYHKFGFKLEDNSPLKDMLSILIAFSMFCFRITFEMTNEVNI